jgi:four helix bundle protein
VAGAKRYEDLVVWQLSVRLRDEIFRLTATGRSARDFRFRDQIRDASSSPPRNIAEGFGRFKPRAFASFLRIARGSLQETRAHLQDGAGRGYFTDADIQPLLRLQLRALSACTKLIKYLDSCKGEVPEPVNPRNYLPTKAAGS